MDVMKDKNRKLSEQEENRAAVFDTLASHLQEEGYQRKDLTISVKDANIKGMIAVAPDVIVWILLYIVFNTGKSMNTPMILLVPLVIVGIVVHELLHGFVWGLCCEEHFRSISFGFIWKMLTPYCTCSQPLKQSYYIAGSIAPYLLLGILPCAIGVISSNLLVFLFGIIMVTGAAGDILIIRMIRKDGRTDALYLDHPYECGTVAFYKE